MSIEKRYTSDLRTSSQGDEMALMGYAARFDILSNDLGGFRELIKPGAFSRALRENQDVRCLQNHDPSRILGRTANKTLTLKQDSQGLYFRCQLDPAQQSHRDLHASVKRGDINECSFAFNVADKDKGQEWSDATDERGQWYAKRTLKDVNLFDVSAVTFPAYTETSLDARDAAKTFAEQRAARLARSNNLFRPQGEPLPVVETPRVILPTQTRKAAKTITTDELDALVYKAQSSGNWKLMYALTALSVDGILSNESKEALKQAGLDGVVLSRYLKRHVAKMMASTSKLIAASTPESFDAYARRRAEQLGCEIAAEKLERE